MADDQLKGMITSTYGAVIAHRFLLEFMLAGFASRTDDPVGFVRRIIDETIVSMVDAKQVAEEPWMEPLMQRASIEMETIGANIELRLAALPKGPPGAGRA